VAVVAFAASASCATVPPVVAPGRLAPTVAFALSDGTKLESEATRGDVVVLASSPSPGLTILAIDEGDEAADVTALVEKLGIRFRVAFDRGGAIATAIGLPTMPSVIVIDREGVVRHVHGGYHGDVDAAAIALEVSTLLSAPRLP
jgi:hypothetical protein